MANIYENIIEEFNKRNCQLLTTKEQHIDSSINISHYDNNINKIVKDRKMYDLTLYSNGIWLRTAYKSDYEGRIFRDYPQIYRLLEVYKIYKSK
jgi:hypothetical protein